jgi:pantoate--beta-alanine ligase
MNLVHDLGELRRQLDDARRRGHSIGFVATMGSLHDGHRSLLRRAVEECDRSVVSVFVNPLQFGAGEDLDAYPRSLDADTAMAGHEGVDLVFAPSAAAMYPRPVKTLVRVRELSSGLEGLSRPTHFDGVTTVVAKLFNLVGPCSAYFGEKDYQQLAQIRRMVDDLSFPVTVVGCRTVREPDGLAMSSRNAYLDRRQRSAATVLSRALGAGIDLIAGGESSPAAVEEVMTATVRAEPLAALDYVAVRHPGDLGELDTIGDQVRLLIAVRIGTTRLIDNADGRHRLGEYPDPR